MTEKAHKNKGNSLIEFALILPLFLLLVLGIVDFGRYFFVQHTIQFATREGMRLALVGRRLPDGGGNPMTREASIIQTIRENAGMAVNPSSLSIYIYPIATGYSDPGNWETLPPNAGDPGAYMRVKTRYIFRFVTPLIGKFFPSGQKVVEAQGTYRNELFDT